MKSQGLFPWSRNVPYEWSPWFAWWPVRTETGWMRMGWVEARAIRELVSSDDGFCGTNEQYEFR